jgi:hypothetical protein
MELANLQQRLLKREPPVVKSFPNNQAINAAGLPVDAISCIALGDKEPLNITK